MANAPEFYVNLLNYRVKAGTRTSRGPMGVQHLVWRIADDSATPESPPLGPTVESRHYPSGQTQAASPGAGVGRTVSTTAANPQPSVFLDPCSWSHLSQLRPGWISETLVHTPGQRPRRYHGRLLSYTPHDFPEGSAFQNLARDRLEELGGIGFRILNSSSPGYITFALLAIPCSNFSVSFLPFTQRRNI